MSKSNKKRTRLSLPVLLVAFAIGYIYFASVFVFIDKWFGLSSSPGLFHATAFTSITAVCVFTYAIAVLTDPGQVPPAFVPDVEDSNAPIQEIKRKGGDLRYCQKCSQYKPPRTHHCRVCKRCILRMDHHCIWINNCVGHANYKIFFIFVFYAVIGCTYSLVLLLGSIIYDPMKDEHTPEGSSSIIYLQVTSALLLFPLTAALAILFGWHISLVLRNKTTIEYYEGVRAMWLAEKGGELYTHPYDLGAFENLMSVLGPNVISWVCPTNGHIGPGLRFPTKYDKMSVVISTSE